MDMTSPPPVAMKHLWVDGLHGRLDINVGFHPRLTLLHGPNGCGKTTVLHILVNLATADLEQFFFLRFSRIRVLLADGIEWRLVSSSTESSPKRRLTLLRCLPDGAEETLHSIEEGETSTFPEIRKHLRAAFGSEVLYVPAFRPILERSDLDDDYLPGPSLPRSSPIPEDLRHYLAHVGRFERGPGFRAVVRRIERKTALARGFFGRFVPLIRYPSLDEVDRAVYWTWHDAMLRVRQRDSQAADDFIREILRILGKDDQLFPSPATGASSPPDVMKRLLAWANAPRRSRTPVLERALEFVKTLPPKKQESPVLGEGLSLLLHMAEQHDSTERDEFSNVERYLGALAEFLAPKRIEPVGPSGVGDREAFRRQPGLGVITGENTEPLTLRALSSGERHLVTLLFAIWARADEAGPLLIDEPELSLHVDWQERLMQAVVDLAGDRQVLAFTHSPAIAGPFREFMRLLKAKAVSGATPPSEPDDGLFESESDG